MIPTRAVSSALNVIGVRVIDHLIFCWEQRLFHDTEQPFDGRRMKREISLYHA